MKEHAFTLANGVKVPKLAFGTYQLSDGKTSYTAMQQAIAAGYRHIDATYGYDGEQNIARAIKDAGLKREAFFLTSKLWNADQGYESTLAAFEQACAGLDTDYLDLFLIRWPIPIGREHDYQALNQATWQAFEKLYQEKRVRAIGVCNFLVHHLRSLEQGVSVQPMVNQLEVNPLYQQREIVSYCQERNMLVESWAPTIPRKAWQNPQLQQMAQQYEVSIDQLCLLYCLAKNVLPITHAQEKALIERNTKIFDLKLTGKDIAYLDSLNTLTEYTFHPDRQEEWFA